MEQSIVFAKALRDRGCSFIHVSSGGLSPFQKIPPGPNYQVSFAETIRLETGLPTIAVGLITEPEQADMVGLARGILYNPRWLWHAAAKLNAQVEAPPQYRCCQPCGLKSLFGEVSFRQR